jgi:predicted RND superfamily exporter protein
MSGDVLALITAASGGITNAVINGITLYFPSRPKWAAFLAALVVGIIVAFIGALSFLPATATLDRQVVSQIVMVGLGAGLAAAGLGVTQASAEAHRAASTVIKSEPDPMTPQARIGGERHVR